MSEKKLSPQVDEAIEKAAQRILVVQSARENEGWGFDYTSKHRLIVGVITEALKEVENVNV